MIRSALAACLLACAPAAAQQSVARPQVPSQAQIINLSLLEALISIGAQDFAGVFGFIPEENAAMALADYLVHDQKALKRFLAKVGKDFKVAGGINGWDKQVLLYIVGIESSGQLPPGVEPLPKKLISKVSELALATPMPLQVITQQRERR